MSSKIKDFIVFGEEGDEHVPELYTTPKDRLVFILKDRPQTTYYEDVYCEETDSMLGTRAAGYYKVGIKLVFVRDVFTGEVFRMKAVNLTMFVQQ